LNTILLIFAEPLTLRQGTLGFGGTPVGNHWARPLHCSRCCKLAKNYYKL